MPGGDTALCACRHRREQHTTTHCRAVVRFGRHVINTLDGLRWSVINLKPRHLLAWLCCNLEDHQVDWLHSSHLAALQEAAATVEPSAWDVLLKTPSRKHCCPSATPLCMSPKPGRVCLLLWLMYACDAVVRHLHADSSCETCQQIRLSKWCGRSHACNPSPAGASPLTHRCASARVRVSIICHRDSLSERYTKLDGSRARALPPECCEQSIMVCCTAPHAADAQPHTGLCRPTRGR